jgi:hypothetical protein
LCGFAGKEPAILQGKSLVGYLNGEKETDKDEYALTISYQGGDATLRTERWRYTRWGENIQKENEELYDHLSDPEESVNLAAHAEFKSVLEEMRHKFDLAREKARTGLK